MKQDLLAHIPVFVLVLLAAVELTMWFDCYEVTEASLQHDRHIAVSTSCNEEAEIYRDRLDCSDIRRSLKPGTAWIRSGACLIKKHNVFAMLGWLELAAVGGAALIGLCVLVYYRLKSNKYASRGPHRRHAQLPQLYQNGVYIEEVR